MPRVKPIVDREDVAPEYHALFDKLAVLRGRISGPSTIVLHSPALAGPWNEISEYLHRDSVVEAPHAELSVCATAREKDCGYVWNAHVPLAQKAGISTTTIEAVRDRRPTDEMSTPEALVVLYARQLLHDNRVADDVFAQLLKAHDPKWLVELTVWIGRYAALAGILNTFEVTPNAPVAVLPAVPRSTRAMTKVRKPLASPRLTPITRRDQVPEEHRSLFDAIAASIATVRGPFTMLLHSAELCRRHLDVSRYLRRESRLADDVKELAIIATAREKDCPYVWAEHAAAARKSGVSDRAVAVVRDREELAALAAAERDVIDYVCQIHHDNRVDGPLFDRLRSRCGVTGLIDLTCLIGHYGIVSGILNAFEVAPPPDAEELPLG